MTALQTADPSPRPTAVPPRSLTQLPRPQGKSCRPRRRWWSQKAAKTLQRPAAAIQPQPGREFPGSAARVPVARRWRGRGCPGDRGPSSASRATERAWDGTELPRLGINPSFSGSRPGFWGLLPTRERAGGLVQHLQVAASALSPGQGPVAWHLPLHLSTS